MSDYCTKEMFKQATIEGFLECCEKRIAESNETEECSERHIKRMNRILGYDMRNPDKKVMTFGFRRALIAAIAASLLLLTSCGIVFREQVYNFFEMVYDTFIEINYHGDKGSYSEGIETPYMLGYVPEGYELRESIYNPSTTLHIFENDNAHSITFSQHPLLSVSFMIDAEHGATKAIENNNLKIYYIDYNYEHVYIWSDGTYAMKLSTKANVSESEVLKIINNLIAQ